MGGVYRCLRIDDRINWHSPGSSEMLSCILRYIGIIALWQLMAGAGCIISLAVRDCFFRPIDPTIPSFQAVAK